MTVETEVLVVGGGPVGLTLASDLASRGRDVVLVETRTGPTEHPKATLLGARSMEFFRRWALDDAIFAGALPEDVNYFIVFCTRLAGHELGRFASPSIREVRTRPPGIEARWPELAWSPYGKTQIGQQRLEPILVDHAGTLPTLDMRRGWSFREFVDHGSHVVSAVEEVGTGRRLTVRSRYLAACDGGGSGIRKSLGIPFGGRGPWRSNVSFYFRAPDFLGVHGKGVGNLYFVFAPDSFGVFTGIDGRELWNYQLYFLDPERTTRDVDPADALHRAVGRPFAFQLLATTHWQHHQSVATRWRSGNLFLAGDAAHLFAPTGGVGMNTGIADAVDLAWKLDAVLSGWGGEALLDAYEAERRPVAWRNSQRSMTNSDTIDFVMRAVPDGIEDDGPDGGAKRARLAADIRWMARQFNSAGAHLGHRYAGSPVVVPDGTPEPPDDFARVEQSTWPGSRAPHAWLADGGSTLDWFGRGFVVVAASACAGAAERIAAAFHRAGAPARAMVCDEPQVRSLYAAPLVLVRPDGHVGWRGSALPIDLRAVVDRVCGVETPLTSTRSPAAAIA